MCAIKIYARSYMLSPLLVEQNGSEQSNSGSHVLKMAESQAWVSRITMGKRAAQSGTPGWTERGVSNFYLIGGPEFVDGFVIAADFTVTNTLQVSSLFNAIPENASKIPGEKNHTNSVYWLMIPMLV